MFHSQICFTLASLFNLGKVKRLLISEEEPPSVKSCDERRTSSSLTRYRRIVKGLLFFISSAEYMYLQLDHKISIVHSSQTMDDVSANFQNYLRTDLWEQDSSPSQNLECQANMKQQMYIKGRKESIPSLHSIPNIQHSMNVKASSKFLKMDSLKSLQTVMNTQIYNKHTRISGSEDRSQDNSSIGGHGLYNQNIANLENNDMGGSLNLLVDAIYLLECRKLSCRQICTMAWKYV